MAKSKFEYVKDFELSDKCLPNTWIVVRIDGRTFHKFADVHEFVKPNDDRALGLMNVAATATMIEFQDIVCSYGQSDEYSFVLRKTTTLFSRRASKLLSTIVSFFTSSYVHKWSKFFPVTELRYPPSFDARVVLYPSDKILRDYLSWRQADCHINNLYNTCFWSLVHGGSSPSEAEKELSGTLSAAKNELLFERFGINYNSLPSIYRRGSFMMWEAFEEEVVSSMPQSLNHTMTVPAEPGSGNEPPLGSKRQPHPPSLSSQTVTNEPGRVVHRKRKRVITLHTDIIGEEFWTNHPNILNN